MQEVWVWVIDWNDLFPEIILDKAKKLFSGLKDLANVKIWEHLTRSATQVVADHYFLVFSNTSGDTYAAVMYERNAYEDWSVSVSAIASKSEVALLNRHSSLQLELLGKILGMNLCQKFSKVLDDHVMKKSALWSGSMNVLYLIKNPRTYEGVLGDSQGTNTNIYDLIIKLYFRCNIPCIKYLFYKKSKYSNALNEDVHRTYLWDGALWTLIKQFF